MAKIVFILCEETMRSAKSGFFVEGTDLAMDFPSDYPLPLETEVIENGSPVALRLLPNCAFLEKDKQIQKGFPSVFHWRDEDRDRLNFKYGRLELDDGREKIWVEYITRAGWMKGNEEKKSRPNQKTIYEQYDENKIIETDLAQEELIIMAKKIVLSADDKSTRDLYRLAAGGQFFDKDMKILAMKKNLLEVAQANPKFIVNGVKSNKDKMVVLLTKAMEYKIATLDYPEAVAIWSPSDKEFIPLISVTDELGRENKFDKAVEFLTTDKGQIEVSIIENQIAEYENRPPEPLKEEPKKNKK